jgi:D-alanine-D-alanine ligase
MPARRLSPSDDMSRPWVADTHLQGLTETFLRSARIAVIHAGDSRAPGAVLRPSTNFRPWKSYKAVAEDLAAALTRLGTRDVAVFAEDMMLPERLRRHGTDFAWLNTAGVQGAGCAGHAAAMMEMLGLAYLGHGPLMGALLDDKAVFKRQLIALGLPTAPALSWQPADGAFDWRTDPRFHHAFRNWEGSFVVKPVNGRASLHVHHVTRAAELAGAILDVFDATRNGVLVEGYLPGREFCAAVCGPAMRRNGQLYHGEAPFVFSCIERLLDAGETIFASMDSRPISRDRIRPLDPAKDAAVLDELTALARRVYRELSIETLVRLDVRAAADGRLFVLEANPKPDLKAPSPEATSIIAEGLAASGMDYDDLVFSLMADRLATGLSGLRGDRQHLAALAGL